ncbi:AI-2E family transporter [Microbacterium kribbense]|uniref:AI-2E family transporter n=1 Tax=Microbacterium kribbense TaxID=433645 RepID=A0ABP7G0L0_9MICO
MSDDATTADSTPTAPAHAAAPATGDEATASGPTSDEIAARSGEALPSRTFWASLNHPFGVGFALTLGGLLAFVLGLAVANLSTVIIYVALALFIALGLEPLVRMLERRDVSRTWGIVIVFTGFAVVIVGVLWLIIPTVVRQITQFVQNVPHIITDFRASDLYAWLQHNFGDQVGNIVAQIQKFLSDPANIAAIGGGVVQVGVTIGTTISGLIIILVLTLYFLASMPAMKVSLTRLAPARNRLKVSSITEQISGSIGGYLGGMVVLAFFNSIVAFLLYLILGLPFPLLMAVVAFAITLIPLVGSVLFWFIGSLIALLTSPLSALLFAVIYLIYMQIEAYVLTPRVMNRAVAVPGSLVVIGALVGGTLLGLLGALVAIPVTASLLLILKQVVLPRQDAKV